MIAPAATWLIRILASGMSKHAIVHRLYATDLHAGEFRDAQGLIWDCEPVEDPAGTAASRTFDITASSQLFNTLDARQSFTAEVKTRPS